MWIVRVCIPEPFFQFVCRGLGVALTRRAGASKSLLLNSHLNSLLRFISCLELLGPATQHALR